MPPDRRHAASRPAATSPLGRLAAAALLLLLVSSVSVPAQAPSVAGGDVGRRPAAPFPPPVTPDVWQTPWSLVGDGGSHPHLDVSPSGDLRLFHALLEGTLETYRLQRRGAGLPVLSPPVVVAVGARSAGMAHLPSSLLLAVETAAQVLVLRSVDGGGSWTNEATYEAGDNPAVFGAWLPVFLAADGPAVRLVHGFQHDTGILGASSEVYQAVQSGGAWDPASTLVEIGLPVGLFEEDDDVVVATNRGVLHSADDGGTWALLGSDGTLPSQLKATDAARGVAGRLYLLRTYAFGLPGGNQNLVLATSDDDGASWTDPQTPVVPAGGDAFVTPRLAVDRNLVVAVWTHLSPPARELRSAISLDGGQTFGPIETVAAPGGGAVLPADGQLDAVVQGDTIVVAYAVADATTGDRLGVRIVERLVTRPEDAGPPSVPGTPVAVPLAPTSVALSWAPSLDDLPGVVGYLVVRDGVPLEVTAATSMVDEGLSPATTYGYAVVGYDALGQSSGASATVTVTTPR